MKEITMIDKYGECSIFRNVTSYCMDSDRYSIAYANGKKYASGIMSIIKEVYISERNGKVL